MNRFRELFAESLWAEAFLCGSQTFLCMLSLVLASAEFYVVSARTGLGSVKRSQKLTNNPELLYVALYHSFVKFSNLIA